MTIRYTLLISYLLISLTSVLLITLMIFAHLRETLHTEIEHKLQSQASAVMQHIDNTLFERMQNITTWSRLDMMQEIRTRDVDKRLSQFLDQLHVGYDGVYQQLFVTDLKREIIASSSQPLLGQQLQSIPAWLKMTLNNQTLSLHPLDILNKRLYFSIPIPDNFQAGELGTLYAGFDWDEIFRLLTAPLPLDLANATNYAVLVDDQRRVIAHSYGLQDKIPAFAALPADWPIQANSGTFSTQLKIFNNNEVLIGYAQSNGYRNFKGFGWRVLIVQPNEDAFASIWQLRQTLLLFLGLALLLGTIISLWISAKIANPIIKLTEFTRDFMQGKQQTPPVLKASGEIAELNRQFSQMIDNLEQSRQDVIRVAKLAVIGEMAASMAHEVRTPLGILRSSAQMLQRENQLSEVGEEMLGFILSESERLKELVTTLLECARPKLPDFAEYDINAIITHTCTLITSKAEDKNISLTLVLSDQHYMSYCDRDQLIQVFLNLIINAIQHTPSNGYVTVKTQLQSGQIHIKIDDTGAGVPNELKASVFDPFFTRRESGIGLGLTVVQQIVLAHQGKIFITDNPEGGACFHVLLQAKAIN
ncbi:MAG: two-component sensor histidine kinase [Methylococcaceae bacterium]|nr:two-component sensor histidine kinase [Methylococcaceae bacterium]